MYIIILTFTNLNTHNSQVYILKIKIKYICIYRYHLYRITRNSSNISSALCMSDNNRTQQHVHNCGTDTWNVSYHFRLVPLYSWQKLFWVDETERSSYYRIATKLHIFFFFLHLFVIAALAFTQIKSVSYSALVRIAVLTTTKPASCEKFYLFNVHELNRY